MMAHTLPWTVARVATALFIAALLTLFAAGCSQNEAANNADGKVRVLTSIALLSDFVQQVGGDRVTVESLIPASADPHSFQPAPRDTRKITQARLIVMNGLGIEESAESTIERNTPRRAKTITLGEGLQAIKTESDEHPGEVEENPHFWLNARHAITYVERIRDGLIEVDSAGADTYRANAEAYIRTLTALDREVESTIATVPAARRKLVTFHDAYPYFAQRYGLTVVAVAIKSPGREASAQEIADLSREIRAQAIPTVYTEPQFNARILELAARDAGVQVRPLYSDSFSNEVKSYVDLMRFNARQIAEGLR